LPSLCARRRAGVPRMPRARLPLAPCSASRVDQGGENPKASRRRSWCAVEDSAATSALEEGLLATIAARSRGGGGGDRRASWCYTARSEAAESEAQCKITSATKQSQRPGLQALLRGRWRSCTTAQVARSRKRSIDGSITTSTADRNCDW